MKNKKTILGFALTMALFMGVFGSSQVTSADVPPRNINNFDTCSKVYGVQESAPPRCTDLRTGDVYVQGRGMIKGKVDIKSDIKPVVPVSSEKMNFGRAVDLPQESIEKYKNYCASMGGSLIKNSDGFLMCDGVVKNIKDADVKREGEKDPDYRANDMRLKAELEAKLKANAKARMVDSDEDDEDGDEDEKKVRAEISVDVKADINRDGKVGFADLRKLMMNLGSKCQDRMCFADLNNDMEVNHADIEVLFKFWTEANEKGMAEKCLALTEDESRSCFWNITAQNDSEVKEKREKLKAGFEKMKPELKGNVEVEKKIENYLFHMEKTVTRVSEVVAKLKTVIDKIESRIKIMEEEGKDLTEVKNLIEEVKLKLEVSTSASAEVSAESEEVSAENKTEFFAKVRAMTDNVKEAHKILDQVIVDLKAAAL